MVKSDILPEDLRSAPQTRPGSSPLPVTLGPGDKISSSASTGISTHVAHTKT